MKIAIVTETFLPETDGVVTRITATMKWLYEQGHELLVIAPDSSVRNYEGIRVEGIPAHRFFLYKFRKVALPHPKVGRLLKAFHPDIVHVVNPALLGMAGIFYGKKWPLVASWHTNIPQYADFYSVSYLKPALWWILKTLHNRADLNLCTSQSVQTHLISRGFKNVHVWKRGVDLEKFGPQHRDTEMRQRLSGGEPNKILLLFVGRLASEKEIEKMSHVLKGSDDFRLAIVGDGPHREKLEKYFEGTPVVFTGFLHGEHLAKAYASSDVFVFPSTTETLGLVILEAMASELPVVAAKSGPSSEQMIEGETGLLFDPDTPGDMKKVVSTFRNATFRKNMGKRARQNAQAFSWSGPSEQLAGFYHKLVKQKKATNAKTVIMDDS